MGTLCRIDGGLGGTVRRMTIRRRLPASPTSSRNCSPSPYCCASGHSNASPTSAPARGVKATRRLTAAASFAAAPLPNPATPARRDPRDDDRVHHGAMPAPARRSLHTGALARRRRHKARVRSPRVVDHGAHSGALSARGGGPPTTERPDPDSTRLMLTSAARSCLSRTKPRLASSI